jgi:hypothetical protein
MEMSPLGGISAVTVYSAWVRIFERLTARRKD